jgi:hypothetical protein
MPGERRLETKGTVRARLYASGGLERSGQGTWMGARRRKRARGAGNAAMGLRLAG